MSARRTPSSGDVFLYMSEIKRIHAGENYYQVAAEELVAQGYPTASVFNWRTPLPMWLIGKLPDPLLGRLILIAAGIAMLLMAFEAAAREQPNVYRLAMPLAVLLAGPLLPCFQGNVFVLTEVWAGIMIALSLCAYGVNLRFLGATMALAALFLRELALPYCLLGLALALWQRRPKESTGLYRRPDRLGRLLRAALLEGQPLDHGRGRGPSPRLGAVRRLDVRHRGDADECLPGALPVWVTVIFFALAMIGFAGWQTAWGMRIALTACMYVVAFSIVGQEFNRYWGLMIAPLFCFGVVRAPAALGDLWRAARCPVADMPLAGNVSRQSGRDSTYAAFRVSRPLRD